MTRAPDQYDEDAKLTAYVLGELGDEEAAAIDARLETDEALREEVQAIRQTAQLLKADFSAEPSPGLTEDQREAIVAGGKALRDDRRPVIFTYRRVWGAVGLAAAACLVLAIVLPFMSDGNATRYAIGEKDAARTAPSAGGRGGGGGSVGSDLAVGGEPDGMPSVRSAQMDGLAPPVEEAEESVAFLETRSAAPDGSEAREAKRLAGRMRGAKAPGADLEPSAAGGRRPTPPPRRPPAATPAPSTPQQPALADVAGGGRGVSRSDVEDRDRRELDAPDTRDRGDFNREGYGRLVDNPFKRPAGEHALSTFSIDVDTASYANARRMLNAGQLPPADAVRIEEMINYFDYDYEPASGEQPFSVNVEVNAAPWKPDHRLVRIGLKGLEVEADMRPATSLVFLIDVSGSMSQPNKLPLVRESMKLLVENLIADDRIAIVVYAGNAGLVLDSTYCDEKETIINAIDRLTPGGSTHGSAGIRLAYDVAREQFIEGGVNRVILCTDGDFNVGTSSEGELIRLIEQERESDVFLSVLGFGTGNFQDQKMEMLSNHGNGNFAYIDSIDEAKKALVEEMVGTLVTIAKDVKIQVDFNPARVGAYRLIGYANRMLEARDFDDDKKDAGEIGAGHTVTALYEIIPADGDLEEILESPESDFVKPGAVVESDLLLKVKLRYKQPDGDVSTLVKYPVTDEGAMAADATSDFQFAAAVASFGMVLRDSEHKGDATFATVLDLATAGMGEDVSGRRAGFIELVQRAKAIAGE